MDRKYLDELKETILKLENPNDIEKYIPHMTAYEFIFECNKNRLSSYAINYLGTRFTYKEFFEKVNEYAKGFKELGVKPKDRVGLSMLATPEGIMSFYALNLLGAEVFMLNGTHEKADRRKEILKAKADLIIINDILYDKDISSYCDEANTTKVITVGLDETVPKFYGDILYFKLVNKIQSKKGYRLVDDKVISWKKFQSISKESKLEVKPYYEKGIGAVISGTSGTSGKPSYPVLTSDNLNASGLQMAMSCTDFEPGDAHLTTLPIWILYSLFNCVQEVFVFNAEIELDPLFNPKQVSKRFRQYRFCHWNTIPAYIEEMLKDPGMYFLKLRNRMKTITTGGADRTPKLKRMAENLLKKLGCDIEIGQGFGSTQQGGCFAYTYEKNLPPNSTGRPIVGNKFKIIDEDTKKELGPNKPGKLYTYSPTTMMGYDGDPEKTKLSLSKDENGVVWYDTEDCAMYDENGVLYILDREYRIGMTKDSAGNPTKFFPGKIKEIVNDYPSVVECEVFTISDNKGLQVPIVYAVLSKDVLNTANLPEQINNFCIIHNMEPYALPADYVFVKEIPKKPSFKPDYGKMIQDYNERKQQGTARKKSRFGRR